MNKKIWGIIAVILGLLLIAVIVYFMFFYKISVAPETVIQPPTTPAAPASAKLEPTEAVKSPVTVQPVSPLKKAEVRADDLIRMASAFAERFGSFSNQSDYGNLRDLHIFMTSDMKIWAQNYIAAARLKKTDTANYYGIVTKSILSEVKQFDTDSGQAEILVKTQRRESTGPRYAESSGEASVATNSSIFYQDLIIKYQREGTVWRVSGAYWQGK